MRRRHPALPNVVRTAVEIQGELWERRSHHPDYLRVSVGAICREHPESRLAVITCDVLPDLEELGRLLEERSRR